MGERGTLRNYTECTLHRVSELVYGMEGDDTLSELPGRGTVSTVNMLVGTGGSQAQVSAACGEACGCRESKS